ncbi:mas-related G-protein coupled receptor member G [Marmota marmota marmota]|uniref:MAS related GPR family member G n=1 Tax=Marmota marmota marmota TaxID=9994 RepID=A0A8C6EP89_MARMA|nr:mas-related G-protein coupled receptor member G [Marmota marmota marmota]XP_048663805.1 mas-related G-protein coupled receptor member G [Marmota marmota marmota]
MLGILSLWRTVNSVLFYLTLVIAVGGLLGNGLVLWNLGFHIKKGPFNTYLLHLAAADFLFLSCQVAFSVVQAALGSSQDTLYFVVTFLWFSAGLWLLAVLGAERCLSDIFPSCYQRCRPWHASTGLCVLVWALTLPAVLLPANACGLLREGMHLLACIRYHAVSVTWLLSLACMALGACLVLFIWVNCCSQRPRPKFCGIVQGSGVLLLFCRLPFILYWSLRPILNFLLPIFLPLATLLACIDSSAKPLMYFVMGRQPGHREPLRTVLQRALGEGSQPGAGGLSLPMGPV